MMHLTRSPVRKPSRCNTGVTGMFNAYMSGDEFGVPSLYTPCDRYSSSVQVVSSQQHTPYHVHPMSCTSQGPAPQSSPMDLPGPYNQHYPYQLYDALIDHYVQQCTTQHMTPVLSPDKNSVFVSDGISWNEVNLEKDSPDRFLAKNLLAGGTYLGMIAL